MCVRRSALARFSGRKNEPFFAASKAAASRPSSYFVSSNGRRAETPGAVGAAWTNPAVSREARASVRNMDEGLLGKDVGRKEGAPRPVLFFGNLVSFSGRSESL